MHNPLLALAIIGAVTVVVVQALTTSPISAITARAIAPTNTLAREMETVNGTEVPDDDSDDNNNNSNLDTEEAHKHTKPKLLPVSYAECLGHALPEEDYYAAKEKMLNWSYVGNKIKPRGYHMESSPEVCEGVTWYVCNCKAMHWDEVPRWELDAVQTALEDRCGMDHQSGYVMVNKWKKQYSVVPNSWFFGQVRNNKDMCPPFCTGVK